MDRQLRRIGTVTNLVGLVSGSHAEVLGTAPIHVSAVVRRVINGFGYALDELLYRGWRQVEVTQPLFIVAPARSGTTLLFHLLAADPRFAATTLGSTMLRSISVLRLLRRAARKQRGFILKARDALDQAMSGFDDTHTLRLERYEEDENFFNDTFALTNAHRLFPLVHKKVGILELDDRPPRVQRSVMRKYKNFIRRFLYLSGPERTYLAKNVQCAARMNCLERTFPDARYIHIVRDPVKQLPSALALMGALAETSGRPMCPPSDPYWKMMAELLMRQSRRLLAWEQKLPPERWLTLRYEQLIADPAATVRQVYEHFGMALTPEVERGLASANERAPSFRKQRRYSLEDYGLTPQQVHEQLAEVYAAYGLEKRQ